jgi:hypothetical protein
MKMRLAARERKRPPLTAPVAGGMFVEGERSMAGIWYVDAAGANAGPVGLDQARDLIASRTIGASTLVWTEGMAEWAPADQIAALHGLFPAAPPPRAATPYQPAAVAGAAIMPAEASGLISELRVWGLFWRGLVNALGGALIVPAPWTGPLPWRYIGETTKLPDGRRFGFDGKAGDIWWVFVLQALAILGAQFHYVQLVALPVAVALGYFVVKWFCAKLRPPEGVDPLAFTGGFWMNCGWLAFYFLSFVSIIGWAWVLAAYYRWLAKNVAGGLAFEFHGAGLAILWRMWVTILACCFLIPIPWAAAWMARWLISQFHVAAVGPKTA